MGAVGQQAVPKKEIRSNPLHELTTTFVCLLPPVLCGCSVHIFTRSHPLLCSVTHNCQMHIDLRHVLCGVRNGWAPSLDRSSTLIYALFRGPSLTSLNSVQLWPGTDLLRRRRLPNTRQLLGQDTHCQGQGGCGIRIQGIQTEVGGIE